MTKRILFVVNHAGFFISHRLPLALSARENGYDVHIASPRSKHVPQLIATGMQWHELRLRRSSRQPWQELRTVRDLMRLYRQLRPDLVHHITSKPVLYGTVAARLTRVPAVVNAVSGMGHVFTLRMPLLRSAISAAYRFALRHPRMRVIFQNPTDRAFFIDRKWLEEGQTMLIPGSGVDVTLFAPGTPAPGDPIIVFPSRMLTTKGVGEFVTAATMLKKQGVRARFLLVGDPDPDNLASVAVKQLQDWHLSGAVEYWGRRDDVASILAGASIVCLPSYREGMPKSLLEAAACALPIVTTDVPGCRDVVRDGDNGFLVPVGDADALALSLARLIDDPALRRQMGARGRIRAVNEFALERIVEATVGLYNGLLT